MADALWQWGELVAAAGGLADGAPAVPVTGFSIDTRSLASGEVFVALKDVRDGHEFVEAAFAAGASAAIVATGYARKPGDGPLILVADTLRALESIGRAARARLSPQARVIAVTGSAGKTTTKEMLRACLSPLGKTHAADKSFNNHWGVPLTLARMPRDTRFGVFEIGMNHAGEITPLTRMVRPHVAIVTNVLPVHVGNFENGEVGIAEAKAEIFAGVEPDGVAIVNATQKEHASRLEARARERGAKVLTFGQGNEANRFFDARLVDVRNSSEGEATKSSVVARLHETDAGAAQEWRYDLAIAGSHIAENSLAVLLCLEALGLLSGAAIDPMRQQTAATGRGTRQVLTTPQGSILLIDEAYNANPTSMRFAIQVAGQQLDQPRSDGPRPHARLVLVLGDMLELGAQAERLHLGLKDVVEQCANAVFASGPNMKILFDALRPELRCAWAPTSAGIRDALLAEVRAGDVVMIKGSNGSRMAPLVAALQERYGRAQGQSKG